MITVTLDVSLLAAPGGSPLYEAMHQERMEKWEEASENQCDRPCYSSVELHLDQAPTFQIHFNAENSRMAENFRDQTERILLTWKPKPLP